MSYAVDMRELSEMGEASTNPFSPGFGRSPRSLVGRDGLLGNLASGLMSGPEDSRYTSILMGVRGSGETVALNEIEDGAARSGWVVLSIDAGSPGILDRVAHTVYRTAVTVPRTGCKSWATRPGESPALQTTRWICQPSNSRQPPRTRSSTAMSASPPCTTCQTSSKPSCGPLPTLAQMPPCRPSRRGRVPHTAKPAASSADCACPVM